MSYISQKERTRGAKLKAQATHTDVCGALYKYVNGKLFHLRYHPMYPNHITWCWGPIILPVSHHVFPIKE